MTSQTEPPSSPLHSVRAESGAACGVSLERETLAALDPFIYRDMRWCMHCGGEQLFVEVYECEAGRVGVCFGCGEERVQRWTRTNSEAA